MEVKCYDCKKMVPEGEAIRQGESENRISAFVIDYAILVMKSGKSEDFE